MSIRRMTREHALGLPRAISDRKGAWDTVGVEPVQVSAGRQDRGGADEIAADHRLHEPSIQHTHKGGYLVVLGEQPIQARKLLKGVARLPRLQAFVRFGGGGDRIGGDEGAHGCVGVVKTESALRDH